MGRMKNRNKSRLECDDVKLKDYQDRSQYLESVEEKSILRRKIGLCWKSTGRRDVRDMGFGGWSRSDVAAVAWDKRRRGLRK